MITHETLRKLTRLSSDEAITRTFLDLVEEYLANSSASSGEITDELFLLTALCNHHRLVLDRLYKKERMADPQLRTWIYEIATPPAGKWSELRLALAPLIRTFGAPPRPKGSMLFSPMMSPTSEFGQRGPVLEDGLRIG